MFSLFSAFAGTPRRSLLEDETPQRLTRFATKHIREPVPIREETPPPPIQTAPEPAPTAPEPVAPEPAPEPAAVAAARPISRTQRAPKPKFMDPKYLQPKFNDVEHLYANSRVSICVLRRALPSRFADIG